MKNDRRFYYYSVNVTEADEVSKVMEEVAASIRHPLRGVVTAAGNSGEIDAVDYPPNDFRKLLDINVMGTFLVVQAAVKVMQKQKSKGSVVLIASMSGSVANKVLFPSSSTAPSQNMSVRLYRGSTPQPTIPRKPQWCS
jgi:NAD(P)-dependent dehydrogenase (short-subunit alcohol dehydrogenase family)